MRVATAHYKFSTTTAGQIVEIKSGSLPLEVKTIEISQIGTTPDDQLEFELVRTTAVGSGGTQITPAKAEPGDAAPGWVLEHSWTTAPTENTTNPEVDRLLHFSFPSRSGYVWDSTPETVKIIPANSSAVLKLVSTPSASVSLIVGVTAKEVG